MHTIILAGGSGTRLFPLSRSSYPKQFIPLFEGVSLFQKAVERALLVSKPEEIYIVTNAVHELLVEEQLSVFDISCNILTEPCGKNTLPAILFAVKEITNTSEDAKVLVLPSDQLIVLDESYKSAMKEAETLSEKYLVAFGVPPVTPHIGYGYIRPGTMVGKGCLVESFTEKPDKATAETYLKEGYFWNSGMLCFSANLFLAECKTYAPEVYEAFTHSIPEAYEKTPKISVDYGIMERTKSAAVVPLPSIWNDVGSFEAFYEVSLKDKSNNAVTGEYITLDGENNLVVSGDRLVTTLGLSDIAVIDTADVLLVCSKSCSQQIGEIAALLHDAGDERAALHTTVYRPWGHYTTLLKGERFQIKRITVHPKKRLSLQYHYHRSEHWVVVSGMAEVLNGDNQFFVRTGESTFVPSGVKHRLSNPGMMPLEVIEVQIGDKLTEDDIIRCEDDYERIGSAKS